jgi:hypothetical protein
MTREQAEALAALTLVFALSATMSGRVSALAAILLKLLLAMLVMLSAMVPKSQCVLH